MRFEVSGALGVHEHALFEAFLAFDFTEAQAASEGGPSLRSRMLAEAVHQGLAAELERSYAGRFIYRTCGPDFVDTETSDVPELTRPGRVGSHLVSPG